MRLALSAAFIVYFGLLVPAISAPWRVVLLISAADAAQRSLLDFCVDRSIRRDFPNIVFDQEKQYGNGPQFVIAVTAATDGSYLAVAEDLSIIPARDGTNQTGLELKMNGPVVTLVSGMSPADQSCNLIYSSIYKQLVFFRDMMAK